MSLGMEKKLEAMEMWCYRRMLRLSWTKKVMIEKVRRGSGNNAMKLEFLRHFMRKQRLENFTVIRKVEGGEVEGDNKVLL